MDGKHAATAGSQEEPTEEDRTQKGEGRDEGDRCDGHERASTAPSGRRVKRPFPSGAERTAAALGSGPSAPQPTASSANARHQKLGRILRLHAPRPQPLLSPIRCLSLPANWPQRWQSETFRGVRWPKC